MRDTSHCRLWFHQTYTCRVLVVHQVYLPTLSNKFHGREDTMLAIWSRYLADNLRNQIKILIYISRYSVFIGVTLCIVLCGFDRVDSMILDQMNKKYVYPFCPSVVLTESYRPRFTYKNSEVILVHIKWPLNRTFVLSHSVWGLRKQILFLSHISSKVRNFGKNQMSLRLNAKSNGFFS